MKAGECKRSQIRPPPPLRNLTRRCSDIQGRSTVFGTTLNYIALRLLGVDAEVPMMVRARATLRYLGGAAGIRAYSFCFVTFGPRLILLTISAAWGKFWLSVLNLHEWAGFNPTPPELWLLPEWLSVHPHRSGSVRAHVLTTFPTEFIYFLAGGGARPEMSSPL